MKKYNFFIKIINKIWNWWVLSFVVNLDGKSSEKLIESKTLPYVDRLDYVSMMVQGHCFSLAVERLEYVSMIYYNLIINIGNIISKNVRMIYINLIINVIVVYIWSVINIIIWSVVNGIKMDYAIILIMIYILAIMIIYVMEKEWKEGKIKKSLVTIWINIYLYLFMNEIYIIYETGIMIKYILRIENIYVIYNIIVIYYIKKKYFFIWEEEIKEVRKIIALWIIGIIIGIIIIWGIIMLIKILVINSMEIIKYILYSGITVTLEVEKPIDNSALSKWLEELWIEECKNKKNKQEFTLVGKLFFAYLSKEERVQIYLLMLEFENLKKKGLISEEWIIYTMNNPKIKNRPDMVISNGIEHITIQIKWKDSNLRPRDIPKLYSEYKDTHILLMGTDTKEKYRSIIEIINKYENKKFLEKVENYPKICARNYTPYMKGEIMNEKGEIMNKMLVKGEFTKYNAKYSKEIHDEIKMNNAKPLYKFNKDLSKTGKNIVRLLTIKH